MTATDRDRERAAWVLLGIPDAEDRVAYMVEQLAAERARVLAPVLAVAEELVFASDDLPPAVDAGSAAIRKDAREALADAAVRIRRAAQDGER